MPNPTRWIQRGAKGEPAPLSAKLSSSLSIWGSWQELADVNPHESGDGQQMFQTLSSDTVQSHCVSWQIWKGNIVVVTFEWN